MSEWEQRFRDASVWPRVEALRERLKSGPDPEDEEGRDSRERLAWLATLLDGYRETDPRLVTAAMLQSLDQSVAQVVSYVSQDTTTAWAQAASTYADAVVDALRTWPSPHKDRAHKATLAAADEMRENAEKAIADMTAAAAGFREKVDALQASASERSDAHDAALEGLRTSLAAIEQRAEAETDRIAAALEQNRTAAAESEKTRDESFKAAADDLKANVEAVLANAKQAADDAAKARESAAQEHLATLTRLEEQAGELVDAISIEGTATGYGKYAEQERKAAWGWAIAAVVVGIAGFGVISGPCTASTWRRPGAKSPSSSPPPPSSAGSRPTAATSPPSTASRNA